jgi:hypothetical protein
MGVVAFAGISAAAAVVGGCVGWIELDGFVVVRDCAVEITLEPVRIAATMLKEE